MAWPGFRVRPSKWSLIEPSGLTVSMTTRRSGLTNKVRISSRQRSIHPVRTGLSPRAARISWAVTKVIMRGPRPVSGRTSVNLAGIRPGVKFQRVNKSNNPCARAADSAEPVAAACSAKAMAAKLSLKA